MKRHILIILFFLQSTIGFSQIRYDLNNEQQIAISYTNPKTYEVAEIEVIGEKYLDEVGFSFDIPKIPDVDYSIEEIALMNDVNPNTDVNMKEVGFAQSLARDETNEGIVTKKILNEYFGTDVPLRMGPETERLEFLNPQTGKYEFVNPVGIDSGDLAKFGGYSLFVIPEILATTLAAGTIGPTGAVITSAGASALFEVARLAAGHAMYGINQTDEGFTDYLYNEGKDIAALNAALTTIYDLSKIVNPHLKIDNVKLLIKEGGKSGVWKNSDGLPDFLKNII